MRKSNDLDLLENFRQFALSFIDSKSSSGPYQNEYFSLSTEKEDGLLNTSIAKSCLISYRLIRTKRKTVGLVVNEHGLTVRAPNWVSRAEIERLVLKRESWIRQKLFQYQKWETEVDKQKNSFVDGAHLPYLGEVLELVLGSQNQDGFLEKCDKGWRLHFNLPKQTLETVIKSHVEIFLKKQAYLYLDKRVNFIASQAKTHFQSWGLSNAKTRWGSCSSDRRIRLNWRLILLKPFLADYVIAHELAHLDEMNHSEHFWKRVKEIFPGYKIARDELKQIYIRALPF